MRKILTNNSLKNEIIYFLRGFGQIMFQESAVTGILFLIAIAVNSLMMAGAAVLGAVSSVISAKLLNVDACDFKQGLYGYNGALAGMAMLLFYQPGVISLMLIILAGVLSSILMRIMLHWSDIIPPYTAPFLIPVGLSLMVAKLFSVALVSVESVPLHGGELAALARGVGQVLFQGNWVSGVLILGGIALHSKSAAIWAMIGSGGAILLARSLGFPDDLVTSGMYGFSAALVAIALANKFAGKLAIPLIGIIISVLLTRIFQLSEIGSLTVPFVLSAWLIIIVVWGQQKWQIKTR